MVAQTELPFSFAENVSAEISWAFQDSDAVAVQSPALATVTMTLYELSSNIIINSRDGQDILGPDKGGINDVDITGGGVVTWYVQPDDNAIVTTGVIEQHIALIEWTWDPEDGHGVREGRFEIPILVHNLNRVP